MILRRLLLVLAISVLLAARTPRTHAQANETFFDLAVRLARESQIETSVPASVTIAQAMWETGRGKSPIGDANNYFGIKAAGDSDAAVNLGPLAVGWVWAWTREWNGTRYVDRRERFRKYISTADSFRDHGLLLALAPRYAEAMRVVDDPREFARRIAAAGYATSPTYAADLIRMMDTNDLYQYDLPRNAAEKLAQTEDLVVNPGEIFQVYFDVRNTGFGTWSPTAGYTLASMSDERFGAAAAQALDQLVQPTRVKRWAMTMVAPSAPGFYRTAWQLQHGAQAFGPEMSVQIQVREPSGIQIAPIGFAALMVLGGAAAFLAARRRRQ